MELFIRIVDGQPFEHPIFGGNFREAFPNVDTNNLPPEFARFERIECPYAAGMFEVDIVSYQWVDGIVKDVWALRPMTQEEKDEKITAAKARKIFASWIFEEASLMYLPPIPYPQDGNPYKWDEETVSWVLIAPPINSPGSPPNVVG
jgi:hypothetical protein